MFAHESSKFPPSLSRKGCTNDNKSEILHCSVPPYLQNQRHVTTGALLDRAVLVQMVRPRSVLTVGYHFTE